MIATASQVRLALPFDDPCNSWPLATADNLLLLLRSAAALSLLRPPLLLLLNHPPLLPPMWSNTLPAAMSQPRLPPLAAWMLSSRSTRAAATSTACCQLPSVWRCPDAATIAAMQLPLPSGWRCPSTAAALQLPSSSETLCGVALDAATATALAL